MPADPTDPSIGAALRAFRLERGLSQEELAARSKLHRNYIGGVERGERNPTIRSVGKMLKSLGVSWTQFGQALDEYGH